MNIEKSYRKIMLLIGWISLSVMSGICADIQFVQAEEVPVENSHIGETTDTKENEALEPPAITYVGATSKSVVKLEWKQTDYAEKYVVYRSASKKGTYERIKTCKKCSFSDKSGKQGKQYFYRVAAMFHDKQTGKWTEGKKSAAKSGTVRRQAKRIAYVGDSIMTGFQNYHVTGKDAKVFAKIGINASVFYNSDLMKDLLRYKPDRMIIMLGMNGLVGNPSEQSMQCQIDYIGKIIKECRKTHSDMEVVVLGVSPVGAHATVKLKNVKAFNKKLKSHFKASDDVHYYDLSPVLASSDGYLDSGYGAGDGIHWSANAYKKVYQSINEFSKEWKQ